MRLLSRKRRLQLERYQRGCCERCGETRENAARHYCEGCLEHERERGRLRWAAHRSMRVRVGGRGGARDAALARKRQVSASQHAARVERVFNPTIAGSRKAPRYEPPTRSWWTDWTGVDEEQARMRRGVLPLAVRELTDNLVGERERWGEC